MEHPADFALVNIHDTRNVFGAASNYNHMIDHFKEVTEEKKVNSVRTLFKPCLTPLQTFLRVGFKSKFGLTENYAAALDRELSIQRGPGHEIPLFVWPVFKAYYYDPAAQAEEKKAEEDEKQHSTCSAKCSKRPPGKGAPCCAQCGAQFHAGCLTSANHRKWKADPSSFKCDTCRAD